MDLSAPEGHSVNDGIPKELCSLGYISVDDVVAQVLKLGKRSELMSSRLIGMCRCIRGTGPVWYGVAGQGLYRWGPAFWIEVSATAVHSTG